MKKITFLMCLIGLVSTAAFADDAAKMDAAHKGHNLTAVQRESLAKAHDKMAVCLRSERPFMECHEELTKTCKEYMGKDCGKMCATKKHDMHKMEHKMDHEGAADKE